MGSVTMFGLAGDVPRKSIGWRVAGIAIAATVPLFFGGCAHNAAETPALQWQMSTGETGQPETPAYAAQTPSPTSAGTEDDCCVYRGGRDPKTGLAYTQL